ncbi:hypothetical protein N658DRAFT_509925 [Parathielavia hyrcaniae]|uniref:Uncharacterized protein n=1 Tax=Parathielavia hyrcaniae TaxID=113614 RepID=A0AAN6PU45_9PEZI|nr:hypothetical protein N658DRAFT_509925 [Parathielavia hyrcaniae]
MVTVVCIDCERILKVEFHREAQCTNVDDVCGQTVICYEFMISIRCGCTDTDENKEEGAPKTGWLKQIMSVGIMDYY